MMPIASMLVRKVDARVLLFIGSIVLAIAVMWLGKLSPTSSADSLFARTAFHRGVMVEHLSITNQDVQSRIATLTAGFVSKGVDPVTAKQQALTMIDGGARLQSSVMAFNDTFFVTAMLIIATLPLIFFLGKPPAKAGPVDAH